jgi:hypothetical protein
MPKVAEFKTTDAGKIVGIANSDTGMQVDDFLSINGSTDLTHCFVGTGDAKIYEIRLLRTSHLLYTYEIQVLGQGPSGTGDLYLRFWDQEPDYYILCVTRSRKEEHTVRYNSNRPAIVKIEWSPRAF